MKETWFTSDTHWGHKNIIRYCNRPFNTVDEMDGEMVSRWNSRVKPGDLVYHVGDFAFLPEQEYKDLIASLNGEIHLVQGNHDRKLIKGMFASISSMKEIKIEDKDSPHGKQVIVLCHYAMRVWNKSHYGAWHLYGHSHGTLPNDPNSLSLDVGVDTNNFYPYNYEDIKVAMFQKNFKTVNQYKREDT